MSLRLTAFLLASAVALSGTTGAVPAFAQQAGTDPAAITALIEAGRLTEAEAMLRRVLTLPDVDAASAHELLGFVLLRQERYAEARTETEAAIAADPNRSGPRQQLARIFLIAGDTGRAVETLRQATALGDLEQNLAAFLAGAELEAGNFAAAEAQLRSLVDGHGSVRAMLQLAQLRARAGSSDEAYELVNEALRRAPNSEDVLATFARLSLERSMPAPAIGALEALVRMHPLHSRYSYLLGVAFLQVGELDFAVSSLEEVIRREPDDLLARVALGSAMNRQQRFEAALAILEDAVRLDPENLQAMATLAEAEQGAGRLADAEAHARRVLSRDANHAIANAVLGIILLERGEFVDARDSLLRAVASMPDSPKALYQLSLAHARLGEMEESAAAIERYRAALRAEEEQLRALRSRLGLQRGGMQ